MSDASRGVWSPSWAFECHDELLPARGVWHTVPHIPVCGFERLQTILLRLGNIEHEPVSRRSAAVLSMPATTY